MIRRAAAVLLAAAAVALAAGCGGGGETDELASVAPQDAPLYLESVVRPEGEQADAITSLASRVGGIEDPGAAIVAQLDAGLAQAGTDLNYADDIQPWLGERASITFESLEGDPPDLALAFEATDTGAAQDFIATATEQSPGTEQETYNGVEYFTDAQGSFAAGIVEDFFVFGTLDGFKAAVDATEGSSLADSEDFEDGIDAVSADNLALGYVDSGEALDAATRSSPEAQAIRPFLGALGSGPATFSVSATPDEASVDLSVPSGSLPQLDGGDLAGKAPAKAWFAIGLEDLGSLLEPTLDAAGNLPPVASALDDIRRESGVDPRDALEWMQDGYAFVAGTSEKTINIGAVVKSSDPKASAKDIVALRKKFEADADAKLGPPALQGADEGFSASAPEAPQKIEVAQSGDQVVAALGPGEPAQDAVDPEQPLADDPSFQAGIDALGSDFSPLSFVSLQPFLVLAEKGGQANDPDYLAAKPYLQKLDYLMIGTSGDDDRASVRFSVGVK